MQIHSPSWPGSDPFKKLIIKMEAGPGVLIELADHDGINKFLGEHNSREEAEVNEDGNIDGAIECLDHRKDFYQDIKNIPIESILKLSKRAHQMQKKGHPFGWPSYIESLI